jgi:hypothetical protein
MAVFEIPSDFRSFMEHVVSMLDAPEGPPLVDAEDAMQGEVGYGGRFEKSEEQGGDLWRFHYITADGLYKWELVFHEGAMRAIAEGMLIELEATRHDIVRSTRRELTGHPLLIWGEYGDDALHVRSTTVLIEALDTLHKSADEVPRMIRLWSAADDQVVAVISGDQCALYVVESLDGYATSCGDSGQTDAFMAADHDGRALEVPIADCVPWDRARNALLNFVDNGNLGPEIQIDGRIPSQLLMMGDVDRKAALESRDEPPKKVARSSLPRMMTPVPILVEHEEPTMPVEADVAMTAEKLAAWARRLIERLHNRELIELGKANNLDEITYHLGGLLQAHGLEAEDSIETADWLANEIKNVRGVAKLFATGGDLQIALRRSRSDQQS